MKKVVFILALVTFGNMAFAQKSYQDPSLKQKRGLIEEEDKTAAPAAEATKVTETKSEKPEVKAVPEMTPQESFCACRKLKNLNEHLKSLYNSGDDMNRALINYDVVEGKITDTNATMVYLIQSGKGPVDPDVCPDSEIGERNVTKVKALVAAQEKKCDVFKLRGLEQ